MSSITLTGTGLTFVPEAPEDDTAYLRYNRNWVDASQYVFVDAPSDGTPYLRQDQGWVSLGSYTFSHNDLADRDLGFQHLASSILYDEDDNTSVKDALDFAKENVVRRSDMQHKNMLDYEYEEGLASFDVTLGDGQWRPVELERLDENEYFYATMRSSSDQTIFDDAAPTVVFGVYQTNFGSGITASNNRFTVSNDDNYGIFVSIPISVSARKTSYPLTVAAGIYVNDVLVDETELDFDESGSGFLRYEFEQELMATDFVTFKTYFKSRTQETATDFIQLQSGALARIVRQYQALAGYGIPCRVLSAKQATAFHRTATTLATTNLGSQITFDAATISTNTSSFSVDDSNRIIMYNERGKGVQIVGSIMLQKTAGSAAAASVYFSNVIEVSLDSTNGIDGTWTQVRPPIGSNGRSFNISGDGFIVTAEFNGSFRAPANSWVRISLYGRLNGTGTVTTVPAFQINNGQAFNSPDYRVGNFASFIEIREVPHF